MEYSYNSQITKDIQDDIRRYLEVTFHRNTDKPNFSGQFIEMRLIDGNQKVKRHFIPADDSDLEFRMAQVVAEATVHRENVFVGVALRDNDTSGKTKDCSMVAFLVVDYDEVDRVKIKDIVDSAEREAAKIKLLERLQNETQNPPTMIVDSGNGFHAYYALDAAVNLKDKAMVEEIQRKSQGLAERYRDCPGDPAMQRVSQPIRMVGSINFKNPDEPRLCRIIEYHPERVYSLADLPGPEPKVVKAPSANKKTPRRALHIVTKQNASKYPFWECTFLRWMREHPSEQPYNLWMAAASTLAHFGEDGRDEFHELSMEYPGYSKDETNKLFNQMLASQDKGIGPITYSKLEEYGFTAQDDTSAASPALYIESLWQDAELAAMGLTYSDEGKLQLNPNIFVEYFLKRNKVLLYRGEVFYEYHHCGVWYTLPDYKLLRCIREMVHAVKKNIYRAWVGEKVVEMLKLAAPEADQMDSQKHLVNIANGMLDINSFELLPHSPEYLSTIQIPVKYDPAAKCERFEKFVNEIMDGDTEKERVLQEIVGYLLTAEIMIHKAFFFYGEGSNGKSLFLDLVAMLIGEENVSSLSLQDLASPYNRASLIGKMVNISTENEISTKGFNSQYFKAIVSGERVQAEKKYCDPMSYFPTCKLVFAVNNLPYSADKSHGLYRRILILPFNRRFDGKNADKHLKKKLQKELAGILNWALVGLKRLRMQDYEFSESVSIEEAISRYKQEQNPILDYMTEMLEKAGQQDRVARAAVIESYQTWCRRNGLGDVVKMSPQRFWNVFKANCKESGLPYEVQISNGVRYLKHLVLKSENVQPSRVVLGIPQNMSDLPA